MFDAVEALMMFAATRKEYGAVPTRVPTTRAELAEVYVRAGEAATAAYLGCDQPADRAFLDWFHEHITELEVLSACFLKADLPEETQRTN